MTVGILKSKIKKSLKICLCICFIFTGAAELTAQKNSKIGGGYAVTGQIAQSGYTCEIYNASNGLPTSDANYILGSSDGYVWICGYAGVIRYDGTAFERLPAANGLTSGRVLFEDSKKRIWVGTNDNGVVVINGDNMTHYTYRQGLPSSSIRFFAEDLEGNVFIGTTSGIAYVDNKERLYVLTNEVLDNEIILRLETDSSGTIYGQTKSGLVFSINNCSVTKLYSSAELGMEKITTILADPSVSGNLYFCTEASTVYYGGFGKDASKLRKINVAPLQNIQWISYDCGRIWLSSKTSFGYLDEKNQIKIISDTPMNSSIEMSTTDYQGNIWMASSTQGIMKIVTNNFVDLSEASGLSKKTVNATFLHNGMLYIGTDKGLQILDNRNKPVQNQLTDYIGESRIRCITADKQGNLWLAVYTNNLGIVCQKKDGTIRSYTKADGLLNNQIRCLYVASDGRILAGTNGGLAILENEAVTAVYGSEHGIKNTEFLTVIEGDNGAVYCGSDGDGIYIIQEDKIRRIGRDEGLSSDVILKIKKDEAHAGYWIITSNSIEYARDDYIKTITTIPYNNNYDIYCNDMHETWILSSFGIYSINSENLFYDYIKDYRTYTIANGLPYSITANSYSALDSSGNLFIAGREGVIRVNMNNFFDSKTDLKIDLKAVYCDNQKIAKNTDGSYTLPPSNGRVKISVSVLDYSLENPYVRVFLEGDRNSGITVQRNALTPLEYTSLSYGNYNLNVQILDDNKTDIITSETFSIQKKPMLEELWLFRILILFLGVLLVALIVWRLMKSTIIRHQYKEISLAKEEADRANTAKSRFLSNMSQEILNPINTIMGMNEMIMREDFMNVPKGYFMSIMNYAFGIRGASQELLNLVTDLLEMTKIETGTMELDEDEYELQNMLSSVISPVYSQITEKGLKFEIIVDEMLPKRFYGDIGKIRQVMFKLLSNAVKYTQRGSLELKFSMLSRENDKCLLCFTVKDTGIGIKQEDLEQLFSNIEENGNLGLNISKKFAELMGGTLTCQSVYGEGSEFSFTFKQKIIDITPIGAYKEEAFSPEERGPYIPEFIAPDADILVADSNQQKLEIIKGFLKATKVFVTTADTAEDSLEKIRKSFFNIAFIDQMLIKNSEKDFIEKIREKNPELPVYVITEKTFTGEQAYKAMGYKGCIFNPIDSMLLERIIMRNLPEQMMQQPPKGYFSEDLKEIPESLNWLKQVEGISVDEGIKKAGSISVFIRGVNLFKDTIQEIALTVENAYIKGDYEVYKAKIQMIKNSAQIIGAMSLVELASKLEQACEKADRIYIASHTDEFLKAFTAFDEKLARLTEGQKPSATFNWES